MEILRTISLYAESKKIPFLLIGGHAVNFHGLSRQTGDVDFVVKRDDKGWWKDLLARLKYTASQDDDRFARFYPSSLGEWPIDLMFVDTQTFKKLFDRSLEGAIGVAELRVISARHLVAMKLSALEDYKLNVSEMAAICEKMLPHWNKIRYSSPEPEFVGEAFKLLE